MSRTRQEFRYLPDGISWRRCKVGKMSYLCRRFTGNVLQQQTRLDSAAECFHVLVQQVGIGPQLQRVRGRWERNDYEWRAQGYSLALSP